MKALITGTPVQIEGEPAEIAQLVELMSSGAVMVEHVHHWRLGDADDDGIQQGTCWCGTTKAFAPWGETAQPRAFSIKDHAEKRAPENPVGAAVGSKGPRKCKACGLEGHRSDSDKCPQRAAA